MFSKLATTKDDGQATGLISLDEFLPEDHRRVPRRRRLERRRSRKLLSSSAGRAVSAARRNTSATVSSSTESSANASSSADHRLRVGNPPADLVRVRAELVRMVVTGARQGRPKKCSAFGKLVRNVLTEAQQPGPIGAALRSGRPNRQRVCHRVLHRLRASNAAARGQTPTNVGPFRRVTTRASSRGSLRSPGPREFSSQDCRLPYEGVEISGEPTVGALVRRLERVPLGSTVFGVDPGQNVAATARIVEQRERRVSGQTCDRPQRLLDLRVRLPSPDSASACRLDAPGLDREPTESRGQRAKRPPVGDPPSVRASAHPGCVARPA